MGAEDITKPETLRTMKGREFSGSSIQAVSTSRVLCLALQKLARVNLHMISTRLAKRPSMPSGEFPIRSKAPNRWSRGHAAARANPTSIVSTTPVGASKAGVGGNSRHDPTTSPANQAAQPTGPVVPLAKSQGIMALLLGAGAVLCSRMRALSLVERL
jgi:hypothetical protein